MKRAAWLGLAGLAVVAGGFGAAHLATCAAPGPAAAAAREQDVDLGAAILEDLEGGCPFDVPLPLPAECATAVRVTSSCGCLTAHIDADAPGGPRLAGKLAVDGTTGTVVRNVDLRRPEGELVLRVRLRLRVWSRVQVDATFIALESPGWDARLALAGDPPALRGLRAACTEPAVQVALPPPAPSGERTVLLSTAPATAGPARPFWLELRYPVAGAERTLRIPGVVRPAVRTAPGWSRSSLVLAPVAGGARSEVQLIWRGETSSLRVGVTWEGTLPGTQARVTEVAADHALVQLGIDWERLPRGGADATLGPPPGAGAEHTPTVRLALLTPPEATDDAR